MLLKNKRMKQLVFMFSSITGKSEEASEEIILQTETGKAVLNNDRTVLYEQQTENLYSIAMELIQFPVYNDITKYLSNENIIKAMKELRVIEEEINNDEETLVLPKLDAADVKKVKSILLKKQKEKLKLQKQNQLNVRRIENADKFKR